MTAQRGFTLIEMAIVLVIITILIGGLAMPLSAQIQARRIGETNRTLEEAREAIIGYAMSHTASSSSCACTYTVGDTGTCPIVLNPVTPACSSLCPAAENVAWTPSCPALGTGPLTLTLPITRHYLPCPDLKGADPEPDIDNDGVDDLRDINNGVEDRLSVSNACAASSGNLPWVTLGTAAQDAWGNRLRYAVTAAFADSSTGFSNADGDLQICDSSANAGTSDCGALGNVASNVAVVVMSHGPNGWGARNVNNTTLRDPTSNNEKENANTNHDDKEFVSRAPSDDFDDLMRWISADQLRGRVCPAGGCP